MALITRRIARAAAEAAAYPDWPPRLRQRLTDDRQMPQVIVCEQPGSQPVIQIMRMIRHVVGHRRHLRLGAGMGMQIEFMPVIVIGDVRRRIAQGAVVFGQPLQRFPGQVQPVPAGVAALQQSHDSQALRVVIEPAERLHDDVQCFLAGVAERRMAEIMGQRQRLGQVLVQAQSAGDGAGHLRDLNGMGQPGAVEIALVVDENLSLILSFETPSCG